MTKQLIYFKVFAARVQKNKKKQLQNRTKKIKVALKINKRKFEKKNKAIKTKNFVIKIFDNKFEEYFDDNWHDWKRFINQMKSQFKQNNVNIVNEKSIKSQRKIVYAKIFFKFSIKIHWKILRKNIKKKSSMNTSETSLKNFIYQKWIDLKIFKKTCKINTTTWSKTLTKKLKNTSNDSMLYWNDWIKSNDVIQTMNCKTSFEVFD